MRAGIGAAALALALAGNASAQTSAPLVRPDCRAIDAALEGMVGAGRTVGASTLVFQDGAERCFETAGYADREAARPYARDTLVQIFSMTKPVTGVALMQLWEKGLFKLDDPLSQYLPEYGAVTVLAGEDAAGRAVTRAPRRPITVRDILRHTAGFTYGAGGNPQNAADRVWEDLQPLAPEKTLAEFSAALAKVPLLDDPGARWHYSAAVDVQARLVEVLSGQPYADYVREHVFLPLGMRDTGWRRTQADRARLARIYVAQGDGALAPMPEGAWLEPNFAGMPLTMGGSGLVTTVGDYLRFARMLLGEGSLEGVRILKASTLRQMTTDQLDPAIGADKRSWLVGKGNGGFGFDFFVRTGPPLTAEENRGSVGEFYWDGYPSMLFWVDPANRMVVIFATQKIDFDGTLHRDIRKAIYPANEAAN